MFLIRKKRDFREVDIAIESVGTYPLPTGKKLQVSMDSTTTIEKHLGLDSTLVVWPLHVRGVRPGDRFKPYGMAGSTKTIKKLCTDLKVNRFEKEEMLVVCNGKEIVHIVGIGSSYGYVAEDIKNAMTFSIVD